MAAIVHDSELADRRLRRRDYTQKPPYRFAAERCRPIIAVHRDRRYRLFFPAADSDRTVGEFMKFRRSP